MTQQSNTPETDENSLTWDRANRAGCDADFARKLERERDEARRELLVYRKCDAILDALPDATDDPTYIHLQRLIAERDQLRKVADELADKLSSEVGFDSCLVANYNQLPHVIARKNT